VTVRVAEDGWQRVSLRWQVPGEIACDELAIPFQVALEPDFWWAPHLAPDKGYVIAQHVFRSPALIAQERSLTVAVVPDLDLEPDLVQLAAQRLGALPLGPEDRTQHHAQAEPGPGAPDPADRVRGRVGTECRDRRPDRDPNPGAVMTAGPGC
jgi:hypothetical protein